MLISRILHRIGKRWFNMQKRTTQGVQSARDAVFRGVIIAITAIFIIWLSIFLYTAFYYVYMPSMSYARPVHLQFKYCICQVLITHPSCVYSNLYRMSNDRSCDEDKGICSFPTARVELTKKQQLLMVGQPYKINLHLEMPESPANKELGMFMVCAHLHTRDGYPVEQTCRSAMLHYRSSLLHTLSTLTFSPMMIFGTTEEKQNIVLELFGNFEEDQKHPVTVLYIEIQSRYIEFYSATIIINAHLSGLRYLMFHWPVLSAFIGIGTNLFFIVLIRTLSYLHFAMEEESTDENFTYEKGEVEEEKDIKTLGDISSDSSSLDDDPLMEDLPKSQEEALSTHSTDPIMGEPSYIQEISSLIAESSGPELGK